MAEKKIVRRSESLRPSASPRVIVLLYACSWLLYTDEKGAGLTPSPFDTPWILPVRIPTARSSRADRASPYQQQRGDQGLQP